MKIFYSYSVWYIWSSLPRDIKKWSYLKCFEKRLLKLLLCRLKFQENLPKHGLERDLEKKHQSVITKIKTFFSEPREWNLITITPKFIKENLCYSWDPLQVLQVLFFFLLMIPVHPFDFSGSWSHYWFHWEIQMSFSFIHFYEYIDNLSLIAFI